MSVELLEIIFSLENSRPRAPCAQGPCREEDSCFPAKGNSLMPFTYGKQTKMFTQIRTDTFTSLKPQWSAACVRSPLCPPVQPNALRKLYERVEEER